MIVIYFKIITNRIFPKPSGTDIHLLSHFILLIIYVRSQFINRLKTTISIRFHRQAKATFNFQVFNWLQGYICISLDIMLFCQILTVCILHQRYRIFTSRIPSQCIMIITVFVIHRKEWVCFQRTINIILVLVTD